MSRPLAEYLSRNGPRLIEAALARAEGKPVVYVAEDDHYRQTVIRPGWESLPQPVRVLLKAKASHWEAMFFELRAGAFDLSADRVTVRTGVGARVATAMRKHLEGAGEVAPPPVARPVHGPVAGVPLAQPVSPAPVAGEYAVGIDLGTTYSLVAHVDPQGRPCCIPNGNGDLLTPSVVLFEDAGTVVGKEAVLASAETPERVAEWVKRDMGAKAYRRPINGEHLPPEVISSLILRSLRADASRKLGPVRKAVITVPAYFEETRRRATMDAGRLAGLEVLDIINEPTAAAVAYGHQLGFLDGTGRLTGDRPLRVLVYDLGGGTFDVTVMEIREGDFKALATDGDVSLGGKDWDDRLVDIAAERFRAQHREDPRDNPVSLQDLRLAVESAKRTLTERQKATLYVNHLGTRLKLELTREEFEEATAALLERTRMTTELVVRHSGLTWADIDRVLLVGGSTRMPMVKRLLQQQSGKVPDGSVSPDEAVAHGAALYAERLAPRHPGSPPAFEMTNVNSHSLGIVGSDPQTGRRFNKVVIPKNSPLPRTVAKTFCTLKPGQPSVGINVLEGESDRPESCTLIGHCVIRDLPADLPAGWPIRVEYSYEPNGRLHVTAKVKGHAAGVSVDIERETGLPSDDLELWTHFVNQEVRQGGP
ncbi:MAG: Hsp70 family protein [Gemmataceae bacterium]